MTKPDLVPMLLDVSIDPCDGSVHPSLQYVLIRGFTAMGWEQPKAASEDMAMEILKMVRPSNLAAGPSEATPSTAGSVRSDTTDGDAVRSAFIHTLASLAAAISLLERTPKSKKAAPSDKMFEIMLSDYRKALGAGRTALSKAEAAPTGSVREALEREEKYLLDHFDGECGIMPGDVEGSFHRLKEVLSAPVEAPVAADDETYEIGKRDGYESAIQDLDIATGGDGEFKGSTIPGGAVDVPAMKQRIIDRLYATARPLPSVEDLARLIDPHAFKMWQDLFDYSKRDGDEAFAKRCADHFHKSACDEALTKATAILTLLGGSAR